MPIWIPLLMAVLGSAVQTRETKKAGKRRNAELSLGRKKSKDIGDVQRKEVLKEGAKFDPGLRQEAMDAKAKETEGRIKDVLSQNELSTTGDAGILPEKLLQQRAKSAREKANTASILAVLNSKVRAPGDAMVDEGRGLKELQADSMGRTHKLGRLDRTTRTLANLEGQTNSKTMMMGGLLQQVGMALASGSIMSGIAPAAAGGVSTGTAGAGVVNMTPVPAAYAPTNLSAGII